MRHKLRICIASQPGSGGIVACRSISVRERLLRFLLGGKAKLTVIVPGDSVQELGICEVPERSAKDESD